MVYNSKNQITKKTSKSNFIYNYGSNTYYKNGNFLEDEIKSPLCF